MKGWLAGKEAEQPEQASRRDPWRASRFTAEARKVLSDIHIPERTDGDKSKDTEANWKVFLKVKSVTI